MTSQYVAIEDNGICYRSLKSYDVARRPCIFFDRDGVLIVDAGYVGDPRKVVLTESCQLAISALQVSKFASVIVTNQSGVGRGYYGWRDFEAVQQEFSRQLGGDEFDAVYACGFHESSDGGPAAGHPWRKPNPGMLLAAAADLQLNMDESWIIGDRETDLIAGARAGLAGGFLIGCSQESDSIEELGSSFPLFKVNYAPDVHSACVRIIEG